ncbi:hypothetical protein FACS189488_11450 [Betaproteobacteria bacterium]|nr:hypothetical protein FACS189488_11450 [Betaproteobacteria bacterium]
MEAVRAGMGQLHAEARLLQALAQVVTGLGFVFNDQDTHDSDHRMFAVMLPRAGGDRRHFRYGEIPLAQGRL